MSKKNTLTITSKIHVCYQRREDTVTGYLSFPVGEKDDGTLINESQWESWKESGRIQQVDIFTNRPKNGFIIQKNVTRHNSMGIDKFRVFHPDGYEFEITTANMIYLMKHADIVKSEIDCDCVLSWDRGRLFLLPTNSQPYLQHLQAQLSKVQWTKKMGLIPGAFYENSQKECLMYLGERTIYHRKNDNSRFEKIEENKKFNMKVEELYKQNALGFSVEKKERSQYYYNIKLEKENGYVFFNAEKDSYVGLKASQIKFAYTNENGKVVSTTDGDEVVCRLAESDEEDVFNPVEIIVTEKDDGVSSSKTMADSIFSNLQVNDLIPFFYLSDVNPRVDFGVLKTNSSLGINTEALFFYKKQYTRFDYDDLYAPYLPENCTDRHRMEEPNNLYKILSRHFFTGSSQYFNLLHLLAIKHGLFPSDFPENYEKHPALNFTINAVKEKCDNVCVKFVQKDKDELFIYDTYKFPNNKEYKEAFGFPQVISGDTLELIFERYLREGNFSNLKKLIEENPNKNINTDIDFRTSLLWHLLDDKNKLISIYKEFSNGMWNNLDSNIRAKFYDMTITGENPKCKFKLDIELKFYNGENWIPKKLQ